jgi:hypothetical protein
MYISRKERTAVLDAVDFIRTNTDGATDQTPYDEMCSTLMRIFDKATKDLVKRRQAKETRKYLNLIKREQ